MADDPVAENAKKRLEDDKKIRERSAAEFAERMKGKPTPTQEENDLAALGAHVVEKEDDGSGPDPATPRNMEAQMAAAPGGVYQTRTVAPERRQPAPPTPSKDPNQSQR